MTRIEQERQTVAKMIMIYCSHKHGGSKSFFYIKKRGIHSGGKEATALCPDCQALFDYASRRLECCKYGEAKPTCLRCPIHCYKPSMRKAIAQVMRYSGPWMLLYHPWLTIKHLLQR